MEVSSTSRINASATSVSLKVKKDFLKFMCPVRMVINGPTLSGKSECILKLIRHRDLLFDANFERQETCVSLKQFLTFQSFFCFFIPE